MSYMFKKHAPGWATMEDEFYKKRNFSSIEEILKDEFVSGFKKEGLSFCISYDKYDSGRCYLMIDGIEDNKPFWWVIGYIYGDIKSINLPKWEKE